MFPFFQEKTRRFLAQLGQRINPSQARKLDFHFLSYWMGYDRGDSFPFDFEPNEIPFGTLFRLICWKETNISL